MTGVRERGWHKTFAALVSKLAIFLYFAETSFCVFQRIFLQIIHLVFQKKKIGFVDNSFVFIICLLVLSKAPANREEKMQWLGTWQHQFVQRFDSAVPVLEGRVSNESKTKKSREHGVTFLATLRVTVAEVESSSTFVTLCATNCVV